MNRANWLILGVVLVFGGSVAVARDARVFPLSPLGSGAGGSGGDVTLAGDNDFTGRNRFLSDGGIQARLYNATTSDFYGNAFADAGIQTSDGGGLGMTRIAAYNCSGVVNGVPCMANPYGIVEIYGSLPVAETTPFVCAVELYNYNDLGASADTCVMGLGVGATSTKIVRFTGDGSLHLDGKIYMDQSRQIYGPANNYLELAPSPAAGSVALYLSAAGGGLASSGTMLAFYNPGYSGSNVAQVEYDGALVTASARTKGTLTLSGGSATRTVISGSICVCSVTNANRSVQCNVSATTLTATGTGTDVIAYICL